MVDLKSIFGNKVGDIKLPSLSVPEFYKPKQKPIEVSEARKEALKKIFTGATGLGKAIVEFPGRPVMEALQQKGVPAPFAIGAGVIADLLTPLPTGGKAKAAEALITGIAKATEKSAVKSLLTKSIKAITEKEADTLASKLAPITDKKLIQAELDTFTEIKRVSNNLLKNNPGITQRDAEAMAKDVIENRKFNQTEAITPQISPKIAPELEKEVRFYVKKDVPIIRDTINIENIRGKGLKSKEIPSGREDLTKPIIVAKMEDGSYQLLDGRHRLDILEKQGITKIDAIVADKSKTISPSLEPLAQEARKWKTGDSADRVQNVLKIPTKELEKNADYIEPYGNKGAKKYGFYVDENAPLEITVGKDGQKISHGYNYSKEVSTDPLIAEARKFKSAEEFVKAQIVNKFPRSPLGNERLVIKNGEPISALEIRVRDNNGGEILLNNIRTLKSGKGYGTEALNQIKKISEETGFRISGEIKPTGEKILNTKELVDFYKKNGFDVNGNNISYNPITKSQLTDLWDKANAGSKVDSLISEARKYKSAEEFVISGKATDFIRTRAAELNKEVDALVVRKKQLSEITLIEGTARAARENRRLIGEVEKIDKRITQIGKEKFNLDSQLTDLWERATKSISKETGAQKQFPAKIPQITQPSVPLGKAQVVVPEVSLEPTITRLPAVIQGETFTLGGTKTLQPTIKELKATQKLEIKATKKEIKNAQIATEKASKLEAKQQKVRQETIENINRIAKGNVENIRAELKGRFLSDEDIDNIILEDGTKLTDVIKVKRNPDKSLSTLITKKEIDDISKTYTDEIPKAKWEKRSALVEGIEVPIKAMKSIELPYAYFERKGLTQIYDPIIQAGRDAEVLKSDFVKRFKESGLFKEGGWFTADRFTLSKNESEGVAKYYLGRQGKGAEIGLEKLSEKGRNFVKIFDGIIKETEERFFETAKKLGKTPDKVENYAPIMTSKDIKLIDEGGSMDWLFRNHPAFFSLKERVKKAPLDVYELDYREVAARWLDGITQFLNYGETTNHLKYLINSDQFKGVVKETDWQFISNWLQDITTPSLPSSVGGQALNAMSRLLRKGVAIGSLGLNYASVAKQALTQIPITIIEKAPPKFKSQYAKAFGINVADLPSITKRSGDIAISDLQGKIGRIFTGALTKFDRQNAQLSLNGLLDKEYGKILKEGAEITPQVQKVIEKRAMDSLDMWYGGFFKGQRPEAFRKELGNFILMFLYPLTSQLNGFYRAIATAKGLGKVKATAEVLAAVTSIAYAEQVIENLSTQWSDEVGMTKDIMLSLAGNIPIVGNIAYSITNEKELNISPSLGNLNNIIMAIAKGEKEKILFTTAETLGLPRQIRRIKEGLEIMEEGGITDNEGKMLAPVQDTMEIVRSFLRGKYGSIASQDWIRNIGEKSEDRRWFVPQVEFLQNGDYDRKAELYKQFNKVEQKELRDFLSEAQQKKLDSALRSSGKKSLRDIFR